MSSNSFFGCTDSICSCVTNTMTSITTSNSKYKKFHFKPESNPDIKSKITSFWKYINQSNIPVSESNFSKLDVNAEENLKDFQIVEKRENNVKCNPIDNKWCHLLQLMSSMGLDKLALKSTPKPCSFCENRFLAAKYADENCYDMVVDVSEAKTQDIKTENIIGEEEILELSVEESEEEKDSGACIGNYDDEIRRLIEDYEKMHKSIEIYHDEGTVTSDDIMVGDPVSLNSTNSEADLNIDEAHVEEIRTFIRINEVVMHETSNVNQGIINILRTETERIKKINKEETSASENMVEKKYEEAINTDKESVRVIMQITETKNFKSKRAKRKLTAQ